ncbi:MAG: hypothetical protein F6J97_09075 [Leptolyngbya sp. SIO4C1]|nr:hypothetical protein [Leptolyngbya sp. SIO4C1]
MSDIEELKNELRSLQLEKIELEKQKNDIEREIYMLDQKIIALQVDIENAAVSSLNLENFSVEDEQDYENFANYEDVNNLYF